jgi:hydrogenase 3 maturation protease
MSEIDPRLRERLDELCGSRTVVLGVGNTLKGDDGVGPLICERLAGKISATVIDAGTVPENHIGPIAKASPQSLVIIDAVDFGAHPGDVRVFSPDEIGRCVFSTHSLSLHLFLDLIGNESEMKVVLLGVQPDQTRLGEPLSSAVAESAERLTDMLLKVFHTP